MGEACADLAGSNEMGVRPGYVAGFEESQHAQAVFEVALLHAVDARLLQDAGGAVEPPATTAEVAFEPKALGELGAEVRGPVHRALARADLVRLRPQWAKASSSWPVR